LHTLRLLNNHTIGFNGDSIEDRHVPACQILVQGFANQIFRHMTKQGSHLKLLSINPSQTPSSCSLLARDTNGHQWPEYNYIQGRLTDTMGNTEVVAVPLKAATLEFPDNWALQY
jgi:hypothetical protein